jgi:hypothetical protein
MGVPAEQQVHTIVREEWCDIWIVTEDEAWGCGGNVVQGRHPGATALYFIYAEQGEWLLSATDELPLVSQHRDIRAFEGGDDEGFDSRDPDIAWVVDRVVMIA